MWLKDRCKQMRVGGTLRGKLLVAGLATFMVLALVYSARQARDYATRPAFCARCHESQSEYLVWTVSSHSKVECVVCHRRPGALGEVELALRALSHVYVHVVGVKGRQGGFGLEIPDATCQQCHTVRRTVTPGGDLVIPHREHVEKGEARCVDCHKDVVHAGKAGQRIAARVTASGASPGEASPVKEELKPDDFRPRMSTCLGCHDGKRAPYKCQACHKEIVTPLNHRAKEWRLEHGPAARAAVAECVYCHALAGGKTVSDEDAARLSLHEAVKYNDFCRDCHEKRPPGHGPDWSFAHRTRARQDSEGCLACHSRKPVDNEPVIACGKCHDNSHDDRWLRGHPQVVKEQGLRDCLSCHSSNNCSDCHTQRAAGLLRQR